MTNTIKSYAGKSAEHRWYHAPPMTVARAISLSFGITLILGAICLIPWKNTPMGEHWGNLALTDWFFLFIGAAAGGFLGFLFKGMVFWLFSLALCLGLGIAEFTNWTPGFQLPWLLTGIYFLSSALLVFLERKRLSLIKLTRLRDSLNRQLDKDSVDELLSQPEALSFEPSGHMLTIMFINITEFYLVAEKHPPKIAFQTIKQLFSDISKNVHKYGGVVVSTSGDGMLCVFGYEYDGSTSSQDHAHHAVLCAVDILRDNLDRNLEAAEMEQALHPLRIGINTGNIYIGDASLSPVIDLTLIGHGVNHAKALESGCDNYCIMIGATTKDMLLNIDDPDISFSKRSVQVKQFGIYYEAYEVDPFTNDTDKKTKAISAHRTYLGRQRRSQRFPIPPGVNLLVSRAFSDEGKGTLINFSTDGFGIIFDHYLAVGSTLSLVLDNESGNLFQSLKSLELLPIIGEIRWGRPEGKNRYIMGLEIMNLSKLQREALLKLLRTCLTSKLPEVVNG